MTVKKQLSLVFYVCVTCIMLTACGGGSEQSGDQLLNSAGELTAAEKATRDSKVFAVISNEDVISDPGETIVLDGQESYDELPTDNITLEWSLRSAPANSQFEFDFGNNGNITFIAETIGVYVIELTASDGFNSDTDTVNVTIVEPVPVAVLPEAFSLPVESTAMVSGDESYDSIDEELLFQWSVLSPNGEEIAFETVESNDGITFELTQVGEYGVSLSVTDKDEHVSATVHTSVMSTNESPVAEAGDDREVPYRTDVELDASLSTDIDSESLSFTWAIIDQPAGAGASVTYASDNALATFFPTIPGDYELELTVSDGYATTTDTLTITAINTLPNIEVEESLTIQSGDNANIVAQASDAETSALVYSWQVLSQPNGEPISLNGNTATLNVVLHTGGEYTFEVAVSDDYDTVTETVTVTVNNNLPISIIDIANNDLVSVIGDIVRFSASDSYDPDVGDMIEQYEWAIESKPSDSVLLLNDSQSPEISITPDTTGLYTLSLTTFDGGNYSEKTTVDIEVISNNSLPQAQASYVIENYTTVILDATESSDDDNHEFSVAWSVIAKPDNAPTSILDRSAKTTKLFVQENGTYAVRLIVSDGRNNSNPYDMVIVIDKPNEQPVADAGSPQNVGVNTKVKLDGSGSYDRDEDPVSFSWFLTSPDDSSATLVDSDTVAPNFTPDVFGTYTLTLTVNDGELISEPSTVDIQVGNKLAPIADAGPDQNVKTGSRVSLTAAASVDADSEITEYQWEVITVPENSTVVLDNDFDIETSFTPDLEGAYIFALSVKDEETWSEKSFVTVIASTGNSAPTADAGNDVTVVQGEVNIVNLIGGNSTDADGNPLSYSWSLISRPTLSEAQIVNPKNEDATLSLDRYGSYVAQLIVFDGTVSSLPSTKHIEYVRNTTSVYAGPDQTTFLRQRVILDGRSSGYIAFRDPETYEYEWKFIYTPSEENPPISEYIKAEDELEEDVLGLYEFYPDTVGTYLLRLRFRNTVTGTVSDIDTITINVKPYNTLPTADAGDDITGSIGDLIVLDGSTSSDSEGDTLQYNWSFLQRPENSLSQINNPTSVSPFFEIDRIGDYLVRLEVFDGSASSDPDVVKITSVEPSVGLSIQTEDGFRRLTLPYEKNETRDISRDSDESELLLETLRVTTVEQQVTITDVRAYDANGLVTAYMTTADNTLVPKNGSVNIELRTEYPQPGRQANLLFEFTIKETNETVSLNYLLNVN
ncbi:PKD domain-containing protein [uncultured Alteromonas sp.]|uniref:PKD domain-containing protein n=1 Tax=uncultured Alteromonas sp. TaxID=179113 RepID=UPI0030D3537B